jgi:hypothetical protein
MEDERFEVRERGIYSRLEVSRAESEQDRVEGKVKVKVKGLFVCAERRGRTVCGR